MSWWDDKWKFGTERYSVLQLIFGQCPENTPEAFWRSLRTIRIWLRITFYVASILSVCVFIDLFQPLAIGWLHRFGALVCVIIFVMHLLIESYGIRYARGRFKRYLIKHDWKVCGHCGYSLTGLPQKYQCPECGVGFEQAELIEKWQRWITNQVVYGDE